MGQLRFFHASKVGELHSEPVDDQSLVKDIKDFYSVHLDESLYVNPDALTTFTNLGPFEHKRNLLALERDSYSVPTAAHFACSERKLFQLMIDAISSTANEHFVLTYPDYDVQTFLFNKEGSD